MRRVTSAKRVNFLLPSNSNPDSTPSQIITTLRQYHRFFFSRSNRSDLYLDRMELIRAGGVCRPETQSIARPQAIDYYSQFRVDFILAGAQNLAPSLFHKMIDAMDRSQEDDVEDF